MNMKISELKPVPLRDVWPHEARDFTTWLSSNLHLLSDAVDIDMELVQAEARVGRFSTDILAKDRTSGDNIIIENQLEKTNHDHLGKLITYASGHDASAIIWVVGEVRSEHQKAIAWLNEKASESIDMYIVKIELWQIDDSNAAPKFEVIESPSKEQIISVGNRDGTVSKEKDNIIELSPGKIMYQHFWTKFNEYLQKTHNSKYPPIQTPRAQYYRITYPGFARSAVKLIIVPSQKAVMCRIRFKDEYREFYSFLRDNKEEVERRLGQSADWDSHTKSDSIRIQSPAGNFDDEAAWEEYFAWLVEKALLFKKVFGEYHLEFQDKE